MALKTASVNSALRFKSYIDSDEYVSLGEVTENLGPPDSIDGAVVNGSTILITKTNHGITNESPFSFIIQTTDQSFGYTDVTIIDNNTIQINNFPLKEEIINVFLQTDDAGNDFTDYDIEELTTSTDPILLTLNGATAGNEECDLLVDGTLVYYLVTFNVQLRASSILTFTEAATHLSLS